MSRFGRAEVVSRVVEQGAVGLGFWRTGGCGAKVERDVLLDLLSAAPASTADLLIGLVQPDDAAAIKLPSGETLLSTLDFAPPVSRDPVLAGSIASINALNDIWACGGKPLLALSILGMPYEGDLIAYQRLLQVSAQVCAQAGAVLAGGHTIRSAEPLFGLAVIGRADPDRLWSLGGAQPGDALVLTKEIGTGLLISAAHRNVSLESGLAALADRLAAGHDTAVDILLDELVHAATDVSGFGLAGHAANLAEASGVGVRIQASAVPVYPAARELAAQGQRTSITAANMSDARVQVQSDQVGRREIMHDPQTAGPLLIALPSAAAARVTERLRQAGYPSACVIGEVVGPADPAVVVHAG